MIGSLLWLLRDASCQAILNGTEKLTRKSPVPDGSRHDRAGTSPGRRRNGDAHAAPRPGRADRGRARGGKSIPRSPRPTATARHDPRLRPRAAHPGRTRGPGQRIRALSPTAATGLPTTRTCGPPHCWPSFPSWASTVPGQRSTGHWNTPASRRTRARTATPRVAKYSPPSPGRSPQPFPLPKPAAPVASETLTSFLGRLAAVNRTSPGALLDILPHWFRVKARWHDRWQPARLIPWADDAAARLAVISGSTTAAIKAVLPAFGGKHGRPLRAAIACQALHRSPRHPAAGPGPSSRSPAGLHQARDLASRAGNTAVQRQGLSRHPGCRTPGTAGSSASAPSSNSSTRSQVSCMAARRRGVTGRQPGPFWFFPVCIACLCDLVLIK